MARTELLEERHGTPAARGVVAASEFAEAMSGLATGVVLVTSWVEGRPWGMTVTAIASVSAAPPTILVSLGTGTMSARSIAASGGFGVAILGQRHRGLAALASEPGAPKFLDPFCEPREPGAGGPAVTGAIAQLDCTLASHAVVADHTVFLGRARAVRLSDGCDPLVYFRRGYRALASPCPPGGAR